MTAGSEPSVLVADDEERYAEAHARMLRDEYDVEAVYGGKQALEAVDEDVDVLVIDRNMPSMSGDDVAAAVRERDLDCRIIMITAVEPDFDIVDLGVDDYLTKPVTEAELKDCIADALEWADYDDTLRDYFALSNKREILLEERSGIEGTERFSEVEARLMEAAEQGLQKSEEVLQTLIQSSPAAIVTLDAEGKIDIWNPSAESLFGWSYDEVSGENPPMFAAEATARMEDVRSRLFADATVTDLHVDCVTASGSHLDVSLSAAPLYDTEGEMYGTMFVMTDITERKQRQQRLSVLSRVLRHNLRNELNVVMGRMQVVREKLPEAERQHIDIASDTVRDLLELSQKAKSVQRLLDEQAEEVADRDVGRSVKDTLSQAGDRFPSASVTASVRTDRPWARIGHGLDHALWELVENAIEHNDTDAATVEIRLEREGTGEREWTLLHVADDGPGIDQSEIDVLQRDEEDPLTHGSGIGLWTAKWIIERSGGSLTFDQSDLGGTLVSVRLPAGDGYT